MIGQVEGKAGADSDVGMAEVGPALKHGATTFRDVGLERFQFLDQQIARLELADLQVACVEGAV